MKKMIIVAGLVTVFLSGCVVHDRGYRDGYRGSNHGYKHKGGHSGGGYFCPPGQAKKGRC